MAKFKVGDRVRICIGDISINNINSSFTKHIGKTYKVLHYDGFYYQLEECFHEEAGRPWKLEEGFLKCANKKRQLIKKVV